MSWTAIFRDADFQPMPEYGPEDVALALSAAGQEHRFVDASGIRAGALSQAAVLVWPVVRGVTSPDLLARLQAFHADGGGLFILGEVPHAGVWYPPRLLHAFALHCTRSSRMTQIEGLTAAGRRLFGAEMDVLAGMVGKTFPGVALYGFPDDRSTSLVASNSHEWAIPAIGVIERQGERYLGARLASIGGNGGEPRENLDQAWQRTWQHDPGFLNRSWTGLSAVVTKLVAWLGAERMGGGIDVRTVATVGDAQECRIRLVNRGRMNLSGVAVELVDGQGTIRAQWRDIALAPGERRTLDSISLGHGPGVHQLALRARNLPGTWVRDSQEINVEMDEPGCATLARITVYVLDADTPVSPGFGFSTFVAFQKPEVSAEYATFCRLMRDRGARYLRAAVPWEDIEPEPERYDYRIPDGLLDLGRDLGLPVLFWHFDTTRGSGLGSGGIPRWVLRERAIDRDGNPGFFPTLWSPFYRQRYYALVESLAVRYAQDERLRSFVIDFGNSDFPYGYDVYGGDNTRWDYAPQERDAFIRYLRDIRGMDLAAIGQTFARSFPDWESVGIPYCEDADAWRIYLDFRAWSIHAGIEDVVAICHRHAPDKVAPDLPGHGTGSIADLNAMCLSLCKRHWQEQQEHPKDLADLHNAGPVFGGEPWQVGGGWREYDDALYMSLLSGADYLTIPGPDLGGDTEAIPRVGYVRLSMQGAIRDEPQVAILDRMEWNQPQSWANIAMRSDTPVDLLCRQHRFDLSRYRLLVLPADELHGGTSTAQTGGCLLPTDAAWYARLRQAVERGLNVMVFPRTAQPERSRLDIGHLRRSLGITDIAYGAPADDELAWPSVYGGGSSCGRVQAVVGLGEILLRSQGGRPLLVRRRIGSGSVLLAGWDQVPESLDGVRDYRTQANLADHSLIRMFRHDGYAGRDVFSGEANCFKSLLRRGDRYFLTLYSHLDRPIQAEIRFRAQSAVGQAQDLATGSLHRIDAIDATWSRWRGAVQPRTGIYLSFT